MTRLPTVAILFCAAALPRPGDVLAESQRQAAPRGAVAAVARLDLRIVIPVQLVLELRQREFAPGTPVATVSSTGRTVSVSAAARATQPSAVILTAAARRPLSPRTACSYADAAAPLRCTVSMP